jgi:hypothetical protein
MVRALSGPNMQIDTRLEPELEPAHAFVGAPRYETSRY